MRLVIGLIASLLVLSAQAAHAVCPVQAASVTVPATNTLYACVPATTDAPITRVDITFKAGTLTRPLFYVPPTGQTQFAPDFQLTIPVPTDLRGTGTAEMTSTGPGGTTEVVAVVPVIFRPYGRPAAPVLMSAP